MLVKISMLVFWAVMLYGLVCRYQCFGAHTISFVGLKIETVCVSPKHWKLSICPHDVTIQKTNITI
jgi:hypothetical protein